MIGLYCRVSTLQQADKYSLDIQEKRGIAFAGTEPYLIYKEAESGSSLYRDQLKQLFADIERGLIQKVWVIEFSRISRDVEDASFIKNLFLKHKCELFEDGHLLDLTRPEALLSYHVTASVAEYERSRLIERVRRSKVVQVNEGKNTYGRLYGYKLVFEKDGSKHWEINQQEAEVVKYIYKLWEQGLTFRGIGLKLNDEGYRRRVGTLWHNNQIRRTMLKPIYAGWAYDKSKQLVKSQHYKPIITLEQWKRVQEAQKKINPTRNFRTRHKTHLVTGLIKCGQCGVSFYAGVEHKKTHDYRYYSHQTKKGCTQFPTVLHLDLVEKFFTYVFKSTFENEMQLKKFLEMKSIEVQREKQNAGTNSERLQKRAEELDRQRTRLVAAIANGTIEPSDAKDKMLNIKTEQTTVQKKLDDANQNWKASEKHFGELEDELSIKQLDEWNKSDTPQRRKLLQNLVQSAILTGDLLRVVTITEKKFDLKVRDTPKQVLRILEKAEG